MLGSFSTNDCVQVQRKQIVRKKEETASTENAQGPPGTQGWAGRLLFWSWHTCSAPLLSLPGPHQHLDNVCILTAWFSIPSQFGGELA